MKDRERGELLTLYADLRVCDVRDGMDAMGYFFYGSLDLSIRPLWRTQAFGIAKTGEVADNGVNGYIGQIIPLTPGKNGHRNFMRLSGGKLKHNMWRRFF